MYAIVYLQMHVVLLFTPCKRGLCPPQSLVDRAIFTVGAVGAGGKAVSCGVLAVHVERNASCLDHIVSYDIICIIVSFVKYGQPMPNANLRCHVWSLCHVSQVAGTLLRFLVEGQPRLQTSYLMMLFWQNMAKSSLVLREMILSCVPWWRAVITQVDDKL